jgi:hypothetical protein
MTTTTSSPVTPDDECGVCGTIRDQHGDKAHEFNLDGVLKPKKMGEKGRAQPPMSREAQVLTKDPSTAVMLRLVEKLVARGLLEGEDLVYIFGGGNAADRGPTQEATARDYEGFVTPRGMRTADADRRDKGTSESVADANKRLRSNKN